MFYRFQKGLLYKLRLSGVNDRFYQVIKSMYSQTRFFSSNIGVQQGDCLSPTLFNFFINDLPSVLRNASDGEDVNLNCLFYADNLVLLSNSKEGLQRSLGTLKNYSLSLGLELNLEKSKCIVFSKVTKSDTSKFFYNATQIETVRSYIYLGFKFHASGSFTEAKNNLYTRGVKAYFKLCKAFSNIKPNVKRFFKSA